MTDKHSSPFTTTTTTTNDRSTINLTSIADTGATKRFLSKSLVDNSKYLTPNNTNRFSTSRSFLAEDDIEPLLSQSTAMEDPFYTVRDNVQAQVDRIKVKHEKFLDIVQNTDTSSSNEFKETRKGLVKDIKSTDRDIKGLRDAVNMVEQNRSKYAHIKDSELASRKRFVDDMGSTMQVIKNSMESSAVRKKIEADEEKARRASYDNSHNGNIEMENTKFITNSREQTKMAIENQDVALTSLGSSVDRLGQIGREVNQELKEQNLMLNQLDSDLDDAGNKMNVVMGSLSKLLKTKDGCQIWTVVILFLILLLLVALVIWT